MSNKDFWGRYLAAHRDPRTRALHYCGTLTAFGLIALALGAREWRWLIAVPFAGYGPAWLGHLVFERNRPETFSHPLLSLMSDFRMLGLFLIGRLGDALRQQQTGR
jgi:hypothetical protein